MDCVSGANIKPMEVVMCKMCDERGQNYNGDAPKCAFDERGVFTSENFMCATMEQLRIKAYDKAVYNDDQKCCVLPIKDDYSFVVLSWYKNRGSTEGAWYVSEGNMIPLTIEKAIECIGNQV